MFEKMSFFLPSLFLPDGGSPAWGALPQLKEKKDYLNLLTKGQGLGIGKEREKKNFVAWSVVSCLSTLTLVSLLAFVTQRCFVAAVSSNKSSAQKVRKCRNVWGSMEKELSSGDVRASWELELASQHLQPNLTQPKLTPPNRPSHRHDYARTLLKKKVIIIA